MASNDIDTSTVPLEQEGMELTDVSFQRINEAGIMDLLELSQMAGIEDDENLIDSEDIRERLILIKRKMAGSSHTWKPLFTSVKDETQVKIQALDGLMKTVEETFKKIPVESLSEILREEKHLHEPNDLLQELHIRRQNLCDKRSMVIVAGETNGGKSTFLNLLLGESILPTDVLHCTFVVTKIVYAPEYSISTLDHNGKEKHFPRLTSEEATKILSGKVALQDMRERELGSDIKEITLCLPSPILKSGVILVDTPGIGEGEMMDRVTMNFVKSTHASAFIYIIKSDSAGGVQEDRLLTFLRAIKERFESDSLMESFDPQAAMFVCHRWDNISEDQRDKVKRNANNKLDNVWPGFDPSQTYFFSTKNTMKHLSVDPAFVPDSFFSLLKGLKQLFDRASHNAIKCQYTWLKYLLQPASQHLKSMITHCIRSNEELEKYFRNVADKQERLMISSKENSRKLQVELDKMTHSLRDEILRFLDFESIGVRFELDSFDTLLEMCSKDGFFKIRENRQMLDENIVMDLLKYIDEKIHGKNLVTKMESTMLQAIQDHLGLFKSQIKLIKHDMLNGESPTGTPNSSFKNFNEGEQMRGLGSSLGSMSCSSSTASMDLFQGEMTLDPTLLAGTVKNLLLKQKYGKSSSRKVFSSKHEIRQSLFGKLKDTVKHGFMKNDPEIYLEDRIRKISRKMYENPDIVESIVSGYTEWIQECVNYATNSIPKFIAVNTKLMDEIREHRGTFQRDKDLLVKVMKDLEPSRHHLRGYGSLYMDDINAEMLAFNVEKRASSVFLPRDLTASHRLNDDSGFQGSGSKKRKVRSLWDRMQGATIEIDGVSEQVVVKTYIYDMQERDVLSEIASLRCLDDVNIATFLGMTRIPTSGSTTGDRNADNADTSVDKVSAFIFKGDLVSARVYASRRTTNLKAFIPDMILSLLRGLNYIHREGLVHMELNQHTVMVDKSTGFVKLCQMCKPREAKFPAQLDVQTRTCVCLSPSVLQGHQYEATDDLYAFGLLLWEMLCPECPPFREQRSWPLQQFIDECHPTSMLQKDIQSLEISEKARDVLKGTLLISRGFVCMPIADIESLLSDLDQDPAIKRLTQREDLNRYNPQNGKKVSFPDLEQPVRPPRRKDHLKSEDRAFSVESSDAARPKTLNLTVPPNDPGRRRRSEPVLSFAELHPPGSPMQTVRKTLGNFKKLFGRKKKTNGSSDWKKHPNDSTTEGDTTDQSDFSDSMSGSRRNSINSENDSGSRRSGSFGTLGLSESRRKGSVDTPGVSDSRRRGSVDTPGVSDSRRRGSLDVPVLTESRRRGSHENIGSSSTRPVTLKLHNREHEDSPERPKGPQPRRFSLPVYPEYSLHPPKPVNKRRSDNADVLQLMTTENFQSPLEKTFPRSSLTDVLDLSSRSWRTWRPQTESMPNLQQSPLDCKSSPQQIKNRFPFSGSPPAHAFKRHSGKLSRSANPKLCPVSRSRESSPSNFIHRRSPSEPQPFVNLSPRLSRLHSPSPPISSQDHSSLFETIPEVTVETSSCRSSTEELDKNQRGSKSREAKSYDSQKKSLVIPIITTTPDGASPSSQSPNCSFDLSSSTASSVFYRQSSFEDEGYLSPAKQDGGATGHNDFLNPSSHEASVHIRSSSAPETYTDSNTLYDVSGTETSKSLLSNNNGASPSLHENYRPDVTVGGDIGTSISEDINVNSERILHLLSQQTLNTSDSNNNNGSSSAAPPPPPPINFAALTFGRNSHDD